MSTSLVIFGATGDLSRRKLVPALFTLACKGRLPQDLRVVGFSRTELSDEQFRESTWEGAQELADLAVHRDVWNDFATRLSYVQGDLSVAADFEKLRKRLESLEGDSGSERLYYLSVAPSLYEPTIVNLALAGLAGGDGGASGGKGRRVIVEKPFGYDGASALALDEVVHSAFDESQVYRIDHYLGKETVQNLVVFRFANAIFEPVWNRTYIAQVQVTVAEEVDVGTRAAYYEGSGVVRDMVQNHLLQLLAMVAMEPPTSMDATALRDEKVKVLQAIRRWETPEDVIRNTVGAQYSGYRQAPGVGSGSRTPTYAALRLYVDNWRWQGVPFYLRSGKAMHTKASEVIIQFHRPPHRLFSLGAEEAPQANNLALCLQPDEGVHLRFQVKVPDTEMATRAHDMEFHYETSFAEQGIPEAYERLLQDALEGDASLFIRSDQVHEAWRIVDPLLEAWDSASASPLVEYARGSWGPAEANALLTEDGHAWLHACGEH